MNKIDTMFQGRGMLRAFSAAGFLGLAAGLWVALAPDGLENGFGNSADPVAARVNGVEITALDFERAAQAVQSGRRNVLGPEQAASVLDTLINEELLAQEAVRIGLPHSDGEVRAAAVRGVMRLILSDLASVEPDDATLRAFYDDNPGLFSSLGTIWVRHLETSLEATDPIIDALQQDAGFDDIRQNNPGVSSRPVPDRMIRAGDLNQYLGATLSEYAIAAEPGTIIGPLSLDGVAHFLWIVDGEAGQRPSFDEAREVVLGEWRRRAENEAVTSYIERLRNRATIEIEAGQ